MKFRSILGANRLFDSTKYECTDEQQHQTTSNMLASSVDISHVTRMTLTSVTQSQAVYTQAVSQCTTSHTKSYVQHPPAVNLPSLCLMLGQVKLSTLVLKLILLLKWF